MADVADPDDTRDLLALLGFEQVRDQVPGAGGHFPDRAGCPVHRFARAEVDGPAGKAEADERLFRGGVIARTHREHRGLAAALDGELDGRSREAAVLLPAGTFVGADLFAKSFDPI